LVYTGSEPSYTLTSLEANKTYYWQAEAVNQYAVSTKSVMYSFNTIQNTPRAFNYPNPFNPATGQITHIVFNMRQSGNAEVTVYSELGDRIWRQSFSGLNEGTNEVSYNGYDGNGRQLYNGTYVCIIMKNYDSGGGDKDSCRLMIIK
jgi:flagellar hook assembly protein FlgD